MHEFDGDKKRFYNIITELFFYIIPFNLFILMNEIKCFRFFLFLVDNAELLLDKSQKMIERFNYPWEMMPLLYVILKYANGDLEEATNQLNEGNEDYIIIFIILEQL